MMRRSLIRHTQGLVLGLCILAATAGRATAAEARNAILMIGDGMGLVQVQAAHSWSSHTLAMEQLGAVGLARTRSSNSFITDSAAAATALACGVRTTNGTIGMSDAKVDPTGSSRKLQNITQVALAAGKSVGIISTAHVTHATPAGFYAHVPSRGDEVDIADQVATSGLTLLLGGGRKFFYPQGWNDPESIDGGERKDGRDLVAELTHAGWTVVQSEREFKQLDPAKDGQRVLGLFESDHMNYDLDRPKDKLGEPSLAEMTAYAIKVLSRDPDGYFLMVEGGRIDHAGHGNDIKNNIGETLAFDAAIGTAAQQASADTLIVVTADHETGGLTITGVLEPGSDQGKATEWSTHDHSAANVGVFAKGPGSAAFEGIMDNYQIPRKIAAALGVQFSAAANLENKNR